MQIALVRDPRTAWSTPKFGQQFSNRDFEPLSAHHSALMHESLALVFHHHSLFVSFSTRFQILNLFKLNNFDIFLLKQMQANNIWMTDP